MDDEEVSRQQWVTDQLGMLLATSPKLSQPAGQKNVADVFGMYRRQRSQASFEEIAEDIGISSMALRTWCAGKRKPQLPYLLRVCDRLGISLVDVYLGNVEMMNTIELQTPCMLPYQSRKRKRRRMDAEEIRKKLEAVLTSEETPPPSMRQVAKRVDYAHATLHRRFPDLCKAISARYLAYRRNVSQQRMEMVFAEVRHAVADVHAQGLYPSVYRITPYLSRPGYAMHIAVRDVWREEISKLGW